MPFLTLAPHLQIHYTQFAGATDKPWLVLLHEGLGSIAQWRDYPQRLNERTGCPVLVYDRQGYGQSSPMDRERTIHYLHQAALTELPAVLDKLIPDQDYWVIGHSDGGSIALLHAAEKNPRLRGAITEAAHVFIEPETLAGIRVADEAYAAGKLKNLTRYHGDKTDWVFHSWARTWLSQPFQPWNIEYVLPSIDVPMLVMQGREDQYATEAQVTAIVTQSPRAEAAIIDHCGHTPHREQTDIVLAQMSDFIARS